ncbi:MAG: hypothetical protein ABWY05_08825, partial [Noviherbaspirillum sp.]
MFLLMHPGRGARAQYPEIAELGHSGKCFLAGDGSRKLTLFIIRRRMSVFIQALKQSKLIFLDRQQVAPL